MILALEERNYAKLLYYVFCMQCFVGVLSGVVFSVQTKGIEPYLAKGHSRYFGLVRGPHV
jgi:hypothetical protein